jgi:hypothetical protein
MVAESGAKVGTLVLLLSGHALKLCALLTGTPSR